MDSTSISDEAPSDSDSSFVNENFVFDSLQTPV